MAYIETEGFQGLLIDQIEKRLLDFNPETEGFQGVFLDQIEKRLLAFNPEKTGFQGLIIYYDPNARFVKVTDYRGNPLANTVVDVLNTVPSSYVTDERGFAEIFIDVSATVDVVIKHYKQKALTISFDSVNYITKTIIIQSSTSHL